MFSLKLINRPHFFFSLHSGPTARSQRHQTLNWSRLYSTSCPVLSEASTSQSSVNNLFVPIMLKYICEHTEGLNLHVQICPNKILQRYWPVLLFLTTMLPLMSKSGYTIIRNISLSHPTPDLKEEIQLYWLLDLDHLNFFFFSFFYVSVDNLKLVMVYSAEVSAPNISRVVTASNHKRETHRKWRLI